MRVNALGFLCLVTYFCVTTVNAEPAKYFVAGPTFQLQVSKTPLGRVPPIVERGDRSSEGMVAVLATAGSPLFLYLRENQDRLDWWAFQLVPDDPQADLQWDSNWRVSFILSGSESVPVVEILLASGCQEGWIGCSPIHLERSGLNAPCSSVLTPTPRGGRKILGYIGTQRGSFSPEAVSQISLSTERR